MTRVKFSSPWQGHHVNDVLDLEDDDARRIVNAGYAQYVDAQEPLVTGPRAVTADYSTLQDGEVLVWNGTTYMAEGIDPATFGSGGSGGGTAETDPVASAALGTHKTSGDHDGHNDGRYDTKGAATTAVGAHVSAADPHGDRAHGDTALAGHVSAVDPHGDRAHSDTALTTHVGAADPHGDRAYVDQRVAAVTGAPPAALDTLQEIAAQLQSDETGAAAMLASINANTTAINNEAARAAAAEAGNTAAINTKAVKPTVGTFAAMPAVGTGSMQFYWASDDQGGTLYQDQTNGGAYTKISLGVGQSAGQELAYAEIQANVSNAAVGLANRVDAVGLIVTAAVGTRPVVVEFMGSVFNTTINDGVGIQIVEAAAGNANNTPIRQQTQMVSAGLAGAVMPVNLRVRLSPAPGNYTWKVMFNATVGGTATIGASATQPAFLRVTSA